MTETRLRVAHRGWFSKCLSLGKDILYCFGEGRAFTSKRALSSLLTILMMLVCAPAAYFKGSPDKITIRGGKLARTIEITDRESLKGFDPWSGQFIDWNKGFVANPPDRNYTFEVFFYKKWPGRHSRYDQGDLKLIYALRYYPGRNGEPGYIYLPGKGEAFYDLNIGTIIRKDHDGRWLFASSAWEALFKRALMADAPHRSS